MPKARRPRSIRILGHRISIRYRKDRLQIGGEFCYGIYDKDGKTIFVVDDEAWESHLFHEIIHCALDLSGMAYLFEEKEEALVRALEHALYPIIKLRACS